jgi:hypothetical protein
MGSCDILGFEGHMQHSKSHFLDIQNENTNTNKRNLFAKENF